MKLKKLMDVETSLPEIDRQLAVRACRIKTTYDPAKVRLVLAIRGEYKQYRNCITHALIQTGAEYKTGRAPTGTMERAIQDLLKTWQQQ